MVDLGCYSRPRKPRKPVLFPCLECAIVMDDALFQVAIVVGGGNIFRGSSWAGCSGLDRSSADYIG